MLSLTSAAGVHCCTWMTIRLIVQYLYPWQGKGTIPDTISTVTVALQPGIAGVQQKFVEDRKKKGILVPGANILQGMSG